MLSLPKLLLLLAVIGAVWYGFRMFAQIQAAREKEGDGTKVRSARSSRRTIPAQDLVLCEKCKSYVTPEGSGCRRGDCPYDR